MKFVLIICSLIVASFAKPQNPNEYSCESVVVASKSMEYYCGNYNGTLPDDCTVNKLIDKSQVSVEQLKIAGCDSSLALKTIQEHGSVRSIDLSYSGYNSLDWLDIQLDHLEKLNASNNQLSNIPDGFFNKTPKLTEIDLSHNAFTELRSNTFQSAAKLTHIYLSHNKILAIHSDTFANLTNLKYVDLGNNLMYEVYGLFRNQKTVEVNLKHTPISGFFCGNFKTVLAQISFESLETFGSYCDDDHHFHVVRNDQKDGLFATSPGNYEIHCNERSFPKLRYLKSGRNTVDNLDALFGCLGSSLETLHLSSQAVNINSAVLERFPNLNWLTLHNTSLPEFDFGWLKNPSKITQFHISFNYLKRLKNVALLKNYDNLDTFKAADNQLDNITEIFENLSPTIGALDLSGNNVGLIGATAFHRFKNLARLRLDNANLIFTDFDPFEKCEELRHFDLSHNNFENQDFSVLKPTLQRIRRLLMVDCHIQDISKLLEHFGSSLERLDLSGNNLDNLNADTFKAFPNLYDPKLSNGNISKFTADIFQHQREIKYLNISHNLLSETPLDLRSIAHSLQVLDVSGNDLTEIGDFNRKSFPKIRYIAISGNRFSCEYLKEIMKEWDGVRFSNDSWNQKDGRNCRLEIQDLNATLT